MSALARYRGPRIRATKSPYQYPYMQYAYQNVGTQLTWRDTPAYQARGADARSLGEYLPVPGGPEQIPIQSGYSGYVAVGGTDCGCGCKGKGPCQSTGVGDIPMIGAIDAALRPTLGEATTPVILGGIGLAGYLIYQMLQRRKGRASIARERARAEQRLAAHDEYLKFGGEPVYLGYPRTKKKGRRRRRR